MRSFYLSLFVVPSLLLSVSISAPSFAQTIDETAPHMTPKPKTGKSTKAAPKLRVAPNKTDMVNCAPGDAKCVEDSAKLETKPTDGAIHDETH